MTIDTRLMDLLSRWEELRAQGQSLTPEELCRDYPELLEEVTRRIEGLKAPAPAASTSLYDGTGSSAQEAAGGHGKDASRNTDWRASGAQRYQPQRFHAEGGLGEVFLAHDAELHRDVALKRIQKPRAGDPESQRRFLLEAEITARLEHPGVVPVHGLVQDESGQPCYAMRFIEGETLQEAIGQFHRTDKPGRDPGERSLALRQLLTRFIAVCNTIAYAHSRGILHRDLKPSNVMLGKYGETLVVDWGLAKSLERTEEQAAGEKTLAASDDKGGTQTGQAVGTPAYMSPEQAAGQWDTVGPASDIYSLGATLYTLLTGKAPFEGPQILDKVQRGKFLPPRQVKKTVPPALEAICLKAMALEPKDRHATALELAGDLEHWLADEPVQAWHEPWRTRAGRWVRRHRTLVTAAGATLFASTLFLTVAALLLQTAYGRERDAREEAEHNFTMARSAVDECYSLTSNHPLLRGDNMQPVRKLLFDAALKYYQGFIDRRPEDPQTRAELARNLYRVASINNEIASKDTALTALQQALIIQQELAEQSADPARRIELAETYSFLGYLQARTGQKSSAEQSYAQALTTWDGLSDENSPAVRYGIARTLSRLGDLQYQNADHRHALESYERAIVLYRKLLQEKPGDTDYKNGLAQRIHDTALTHRLLTGHLDEAERYYLQAIELQKELVKDNPSVTAFKQSLASSYTNLGILHFRERQNPKKALVWYSKALEIQEQLVQTNPAVTHYQQGLANAHGNLGNFHRERMPKKAMEHFEKCLSIYEKLARDNPRETTFQVHLAMTYANIGDMQADAGRKQEGLKSLQDGVRILEKVAADEPTQFWPRNMLGTTLGDMAKLLTNMGRHAEALKAYNDAVTQHKSLHERHSDVGEYRRRLSDHYQGLASLQRQLGDHAAAVETSLERRKLWPNNPGELFALTGELASCIPLVDQNKADLTPQAKADRLKYADLAMETLLQATQNGYKDLANIKKEKNLDPLRSRDDFKKVLTELEAKLKPEAK